ncbi:hypothetical protein VK792_01965 [Mesobacterium sp. TK19101]|uniref:Lipoprotein n=1 Tax=Mesobacterium hydrothermale TaxID=3111907 RepID=A0ABU6HC40_9RHOB|nr:hypothetical protein [Mesobacterium sp. TK19101]MEC3860039.1 hypothetical protein [Mesobacterium sp. TK19101]
MVMTLGAATVSLAACSGGPVAVPFLAKAPQAAGADVSVSFLDFPRGTTCGLSDGLLHSEMSRTKDGSRITVRVPQHGERASFACRLPDGRTVRMTRNQDLPQGTTQAEITLTASGQGNMTYQTGGETRDFAFANGGAGE